MVTPGRFAKIVAVAALSSGAPSTAIALWRGDDVLESSRAAGTLVLGEDAEPVRLLLAGAVAHVTISAWWAGALSLCLPAGRRTRWGLVAGLAIAAIDLGVVGRRYPRVSALAPLPQIADHVAFGALVGWMLDRAEPVHGPTMSPGTLRPS